jgi:MATE family multidrug resistance protein
MKPTRPQEAGALFRISLPLIFAYLADVAMIVTAKAVIGKLGFMELGAAGVSTDISYQLAIVIMGFFSVVGVLASTALGAKRREDVLPALAQGMVLAFLLGGALTIFVLNLDATLIIAKQDPAVVDMARPFLSMFAWAMLPLIWFAVMRAFVAALMRTGFVMFITIVTVVLNYVLMYGLVHGAYGLPAMGLAGAGVAWTISMWFKCICLAIYTGLLFVKQKLVFPGRSWFHGWWHVGALIRLGLPVGGIVALESGLFAAVSLMSGALGTKELASYQMMMAWIAIPFVISLGFSEAAMVRVSYWAGAKDGPAARQAGNLGMVIGVAIPLVLISIPVFVPRVITDTFLSPGSVGYTEIAALVVELLLIAAVFQVFDGLQAIASHALRGLQDAVIPLVIAGTGYWLIGLGLAYAFAFPLGFGVFGLWWGSAIGIAFVGTLLAWRFELLARRFAD